MGANNIYDPYILEFIPSDFDTGNILTVTHDWGRDINIQVKIDDEIVIPDINIIDENSFTLQFFEEGMSVPKTGKVIVS